MLFYQPRIPQLCTNAFQFFKSWWSTSFTYKVMTLLETAGLCVLVFACFLYRIEKKVFGSIDCYGIVYDIGSGLCSCIASILPSSCRPYYKYRPRIRHRPRRRYTSPFPWSQRPRNAKRNSSGIANRGGKYRYFRRKGSRAERARKRSYYDSKSEEPTTEPSSSSRLRSFASKLLPQFTLPQVRFPKLVILYYRVPAKYWSWKR